MEINFQITTSIFQSMLDAIPHDVIITNADRDILYANVKAKVNLFKTFDRTLKVDFNDLINEFISGRDVEPKEEFIAMIKNAFESQYLAGELKISLTRNHARKFYEVSSNPIFDAEQGYLGRIWLFKDVTEQELLSQEKSDFLSIASHQLRTPVTSLVGYTDMVLNGDYGHVPNELFEPLDSIKQASTQMADLINDLLNLSRIDSGTHHELKHEAIDLIALVNELIEEFKFKAQNKNMTLNLNKYADSVMVTTDVSRIKESLKNLIDNAIKYGRNDTSVEITIEQGTEELVIIKIRDYGVGIPTNQQGKIFGKFFRANNVLTEGFQGTGIGLYYVKKCMDDLNATIEFNSVQNQGTTFQINLPINPAV